VSAFIGAFGAALLSAGVGLNFGTVALVGVVCLYVLQLSKRKDIVFGLIGIIIGVLIQIATPAKAPSDNLVLLAGLAALLSLHV
jgi:hypothetical protein